MPRDLRVRDHLPVTSPARALLYVASQGWRLGAAGIKVTRITWGQPNAETLAVIARLAISLSPAHIGGR